ncbi:MAG: hypothetical protein ACLFR0_03745 [Alphaproteobacteria bacterium]
MSISKTLLGAGAAVFMATATQAQDLEPKATEVDLRQASLDFLTDAICVTEEFNNLAIEPLVQMTVREARESIEGAALTSFGSLAFATQLDLIQISNIYNQNTGPLTQEEHELSALPVFKWHMFVDSAEKMAPHLGTTIEDVFDGCGLEYEPS